MEANKIIITGGATRIGAAIARKLSGPGVEIVIHYNKSKSNAEKLKKELSKNSTKVYLVKGNLSKEPDLKKKVKLTFAESCTGGLLSSLITSFPNSSKIFSCGYVAYSNLSKEKMLGVSKKTLKK